MAKMPTLKKRPDETDALLGKYQQEDWLQRKFDWRGTTLGSLTTEDPIDTQQRAVELATNGHAGVGTDYPIAASNEMAYHQLKSLERWAAQNLRDGNHMRDTLVDWNTQMDHEAFTRSVTEKAILPPVALAYKPVIRDTAAALPAAETEEDQQRQQAQKRP